MARVVVSLPRELWSTRNVEVIVVAVHVRPGDVVREGQVLVEVEGDKAVIEIESHVSGRVAEVYVKPGDKVSPGQPLVAIEVGEG